MSDSTREGFRFAALEYRNQRLWDPATVDVVEALHEGAACVADLDAGTLIELLTEHLALANGQTGMQECCETLWTWEARVGHVEVARVLAHLGGMDATA